MVKHGLIFSWRKVSISKVSNDHVEKLKIILTNSIKFTLEIEKNGSQSFLNITISHENNKFAISVCRKPTFKGIFTNIESFIPEMCKHGLTETFLNRSFRLYSNYKNFHQEIETLYTNTIITAKTSWIKVIISFWINYLSKKSLMSWFIQRSDFCFTIFRKKFTWFKNKAKVSYRKRFTILYKTKVIFRSKCILSTMFQHKDSLEKNVCCETIY